jgi:hypothetical protein
VSLEKTPNHSALARVIVIVPSGASSCESTSTEFVVWSLPCTEGNEAHHVSTGTVGSVREEAERGAPLAHGEGLWLSIELLVRGAWPSRGLPL